MSERMKRINALIQQQLGEVILEEIEFPLGTLATITKVDTSRDLKLAKIWVTILPWDREKEVLGILIKRKTHVQHELHHRIKLRVSPKIFFHIDETEKKAQRIEDLIDKVSQEK